MVKKNNALVQRVQDHFGAGLGETVEWFEQQMADYYYRATTETERIWHIEFVHAMRTMPSAGLSVVDDVDAGKVVVFGPPRSDTFAEALHLVGDRSFKRIEIHTTRDRSVALLSFVYRESAAASGFNRQQREAEVVAATCNDELCIPQHIVHQYLENVDDGYLSRSTNERIARHISAWISVEDPEHIHVEVDNVRQDGRSMARVLLAGRIGRRDYFARLARFLNRHGLYLERGYMDEVPTVDGESGLLISTIYVTEADGSLPSGRRRQQIAAELTGLRRFFTGPLGKVADQLSYAQHQFELLSASIDFAAQILHSEHQFLDVREAGRLALEHHPEICRGISDLVDKKFGTKTIAEKAWDKRFKDLQIRIANTEDLAMVTILSRMLDFVAHIRATNLYCPHRLAQSFLLDPSILPSEQFKHTAYAVIYYHGSHGMGFQVRFKASARGGLRLLLPRTQEQRSRYRNRLLAEVYELAYAQQLKNKDIPEGGSKCIAMVHPNGDPDELVKQLSDSIIDLVLPPSANPKVKGPFGKTRDGDLVFLGPDENMTPERIQWVADRAVKRGLPHPLTLMSSKPGSGINHKEYGVTSEGIWVWTQHVLTLLDIGEKSKWRLSMTGGPDGDVGGNLLRIIYRDHGKRCQVLSIGDGSGCAYDPNGLNWKELLRLVDEGLAIAAFNPKKLSKDKQAHVTPVKDPASEKLRNNIHNMVECDLFIPCGGRPFTIEERNWRDFLKPDGKPVARAMVEGANIFITSGARESLEKLGLIVIKDSSANKGGVITSSYEILAGLVMDEAEFAKVKAQYVPQTIEILREMVALEAQALIEAWHRRGRQALLSSLSQGFSVEINRLATIFEPFVDKLRTDPVYRVFFAYELSEHCPPIMVKKYAERLHDRIPPAHLTAILTKRLASRMLYREGLTWCKSYVNEQMAENALRAYIDAHEEVRTMMSRLKKTDLKLDNIEEMIADGSRREIVRRRLGR